MHPLLDKSFSLQKATLEQERWFIFKLNSMFYASYKTSTLIAHSFDIDDGIRVGNLLSEISYLNSA